SEDEATLEPGSSLLLYTDGLVERRGESIDQGLERLRAGASAMPEAPAARQVANRLTSSMLADDGEDDAALLVVQALPLSDRLEVTIGADPGSLAVVRRELTRWLEAGGVGAADVGAIVLASAEAAMNVVEHAYGPDGGELELTAGRVGPEVIV